jgi:NAD-dependent dihydropyrimidine dehydrogenase PreA subunit
MATKTLKVKFQSNCIGCDLCIFEAQRQLKKVGLEGSLIRVLKSKPEEAKKLEFYVELDPRINKLDIEKIANICPKAVFEISEEETDGFSI